MFSRTFYLPMVLVLVFLIALNSLINRGFITFVDSSTKAKSTTTKKIIDHNLNVDKAWDIYLFACKFEQNKEWIDILYRRLDSLEFIKAIKLLYLGTCDQLTKLKFELSLDKFLKVEVCPENFRHLSMLEWTEKANLIYSLVAPIEEDRKWLDSIEYGLEPWGFIETIKLKYLGGDAMVNSLL